MRRLEVDGELQLSMDGLAVGIVAEGSHVRAEIAGFAETAERVLRRPSLRLAASGYVLVRRLSRSLAKRGLTLTLTRAGNTVAELGSGVRGVAGARLVGLERVRIYRTK